jgi:hypothetical protein
LNTQERSALQEGFKAMEPAGYYDVGVRQKSADLESWAKANGQDSVITLDGGKLYAELEPLNSKLANEVFGPGAWDLVKAA